LILNEPQDGQVLADVGDGNQRWEYIDKLVQNKFFILNIEELKVLQKFLSSVGYISYIEFEEIHELSKRIDDYFRNSKEQDKILETDRASKEG
jgi:hypothetical protein